MLQHKPRASEGSVGRKRAVRSHSALLQKGRIRILPEITVAGKEQNT